MRKGLFLFRTMLLLGFVLGGFVTPAVASNLVETSSNLSAQQQASPLKGVVLDAQTNEPIIGANIYIKELSTGAITDLDGNYEVNAPVGSKMAVSFVGYISIEVTATAGVQTIKLQEDRRTLDEVVVVGYGVQKKESLTGSMQVLKSDKLTNITSPSVENMLASKAPGVQVAPGSGQPGSSGAVMIRGKSTINASTAPLWVIDGVIVGSSAGALNPDDIESMSILKDAASTAIYGSQGANGVILITTKSASSEKLTINVSAKVGFTKLNNGRLSMMDGAELYDLYSSFSNQEQVSFPRWNEDLRDSNFSWWDLATTTGVAQDYNLSISGGGEQLTSFFSFGVYDEEGAVRGYDYRRYNARLKTDYKPFDFITIKPNISASRRKIDNQQYSVGAMYSNLPWDSPFDEDGNIVDHKSETWVNSNQNNYLKDLQWNKSAGTYYEIMGGVDFDIRITDWLTFVSVNNYKWNDNKSNSYTDPRSSSGEGVGGRITESSSSSVRRYTNQLLRFNKVFGRHDVTALLAYEFNDYEYKSVNADGTGFIPGFEVLDVTSVPESVRGGKSEWAVRSFLFNGTYAYDHRYLAQLSLRRDGASNFGSNKKFGNFFSISGGWNIHREKFFKADWVDELKLRISYGSVGNRPHTLYPQYDLYSASSDYNENPGALISQVGNANLTWEKTYTTGLGIDASFFDRLRINLDFYFKKTDNLLHPVPVSGLTGVTRIWRNIGELQNKGIELTLGADLIQTKDWHWGLDFNIGHNKNKVKDLYGEARQIIRNDVLNIAGTADKLLRRNLDSDTYYLPEWAGVNVETGAPQWYKTVTADDGTTTREITGNYAEADQITSKSSAPKAFGGFSTSLSYKNIDFNAVFGFSFGGYLYNYSRTEYDSDGAYTDRNQMKLKSGWNRWEKPGDVATHPLPSYNNKSNSNKASTRYIESSNFLKLRSLSIGYNLSLPKYYIQNLRVFFSAENLFTITPYSGVDPEIPIVDGKITGSVGPSVYPSARKFMFGLNVTL